MRCQVRSRLAMHKERQAREAELDKRAASDPHAAFVEYERKLRERAEEEEARKASKKDRAKEKREEQVAAKPAAAGVFVCACACVRVR